MARQYVTIRFRAWDKRTYTYHWDGEPVNVGDTVKVETRDGWTAVSVEAVTEVAPPYVTKAIAGKGDAVQPEEAKPVPPRRKRPDRGAGQGAFDLDVPPVVTFGDDGEPHWREDQ